jgi:hypothetical protein
MSHLLGEQTPNMGVAPKWIFRFTYSFGGSKHVYAAKPQGSRSAQNFAQRIQPGIGAGLGPLAGKIWRFGLIGYSARSENVMLCLSALGYVLSDMGLPVKVGTAEAAAHDAYSAQHAVEANEVKRKFVTADGHFSKKNSQPRLVIFLFAALKFFILNEAKDLRHDANYEIFGSFTSARTPPVTALETGRWT